MNSRSNDRGDSGAAAVEFALVLPFLLLIVFGIVDFGRYYHAQVTLTHGAREGVRSLVLGGTTAELTPRLDPANELSLVPGVIDAPVTVGADSLECTDTVSDARLILQTQFTFLTPLPGLVEVLSTDETVEFSDGLTVQGEAVMRCGG